MGKIQTVDTDPLRDAEYDACDGCTTKPRCDLYASGQVVDCSSNMQECEDVEEIEEVNLRLDPKLERKFAKMMISQGIVV